MFGANSTVKTLARVMGYLRMQINRSWRIRKLFGRTLWWSDSNREADLGSLESTEGARCVGIQGYLSRKKRLG